MATSTDPNPVRRDTRVFISAVTRELGSVRKLVKKGLEDSDYHAVEQDNFPPDYRDLKEKLRQRIALCDAMVHIAGPCCGAELAAARTVDRACNALAKLALDQKTGPLLDQLLGPFRSAAEVFEALDRQYRKQGKPSVWFLPLDQPIASRLDELPGKAPE